MAKDGNIQCIRCGELAEKPVDSPRYCAAHWDDYWDALCRARQEFSIRRLSRGHDSEIYAIDHTAFGTFCGRIHLHRDQHATFQILVVLHADHPWTNAAVQMADDDDAKTYATLIADRAISLIDSWGCGQFIIDVVVGEEIESSSGEI